MRADDRLREAIIEPRKRMDCFVLSPSHAGMLPLFKPHQHIEDDDGDRVDHDQCRAPEMSSVVKPCCSGMVYFRSHDAPAFLFLRGY